ncbi:hypothetical protein, partial [Chitinophaga sp.]|uniref:hypothetical protein n=1 Tax=Chitinophaga sp. TaxID=1869181 RepID=UPI002F932D26
LLTTASKSSNKLSVSILCSTETMFSFQMATMPSLLFPIPGGKASFALYELGLIEFADRVFVPLLRSD